MSRPKPDRLMALLCLLSFVDSFGYAIVIPLFPFFAERQGASAIAIGAILGGYSLCQFITAPFIGRLSDRVGRRPVLLASQAGSAAGFLLMAVSGSVWLLALSRLIDGATAGNVSLVYASVMDRYEEREWGRRFSFLSSASGLGILFGLGVTTVIAGPGLPAASLVAFGLCLFAITITWAVLPGTEALRSVPKVAMIRTVRIGRRALHGAIALKFIATLTQTGFVLAFPLYLARLLDFTARQASFLMLAVVVMVAVFQVVALPLAIERLKARRAALAGFLMIVVGGIVTALAGNAPFVVVGALAVLVGGSLLGPALTGLLAASSRTGEGAAMGLNQSVASAGQMAGPPIAYAALAVFSTTGFGVLSAVCAIGGACILCVEWGRHGQP